MNLLIALSTALPQYVTSAALILTHSMERGNYALGIRAVNFP